MLLTSLLAGLFGTLSAEVTNIELERTFSGRAQTYNWYNRIDVTLTNRGAEPQPLRLCPSDAVVERSARTGAAHAADGEIFTAFAIAPAGSRNWSSKCQEAVLAPGAAKSLSFFVKDVPGGRAARHFLRIKADGTDFVFGPPAAS